MRRTIHSTDLPLTALRPLAPAREFKRSTQVTHQVYEMDVSRIDRMENVDRGDADHPLPGQRMRSYKGQACRLTV